jgi:hypothetical protein
VSFERQEFYGTSTDEISIAGLAHALRALKDEEVSIEVREIDDEQLVVSSGSARLIVSLKPEVVDADGESKEIEEFTGSGPMLEIWSEVVYNLGDLTLKRKLELYQRFSQFPHSYGLPIVGDESLTLILHLPTTNATHEYLARIASEVAIWIDVIDNVIASEWGGLEASDSGPDMDQGNTTHAEY